MRAIVKAFVAGTLGLAVLFGSPAISLARQKKPIKKMGCDCMCISKDSEGKEQHSDAGWLDDGNDGKNCKYFHNRKWTCRNGADGKLAFCTTGPERAGKLSGSGAVQRPQGGVIEPVTPSQPPVGPRQPQVVPGLKQQ